MSTVLENDFIRLELNDGGALTALVNRKTGTAFAAPHGLWRLVYCKGECQEIELKAENAAVRMASNKKKFRIEYRDPVGSDGKKFSLKVLVDGELIQDEVHFSIIIHSGTNPECTIRECHFPLITLTPEAEKMALYTPKQGGKVLSSLAAEKYNLRNHGAAYQGMDHLYQRHITTYPSHQVSVNCFELNNGKEGLYFGNHAPGFTTTCHLIELENREKINFGMIKLPFLGSGNQVIYDEFVVSLHEGSWHKGADKYRKWAESWFKFSEIPEAVRNMQGWQRIIARSQYGDNNYPFDQLGKLCEDGLKAGIDTILLFGWHHGGHDNDYPNYVVSDSLGGKEGLKKGIAEVHSKGGKIILYSNGQLIDHNSDFYRYGNGKAIATKDMLGNEHLQHWGFSGRGTLGAVIGGRTFSRACPSSREFFGIQKKFIDLAAEVGADGVFFDQLGEGDQICFDSGHGHAVPYTGIMEARAGAVEKLRAYAHNKNLSFGIELICDATAQHTDYIHSTPGGATALNPDYQKHGEKPFVAQDFSLFRYIFPEVLLSNREIRDNTDMVRRVNYMVVQNLISDVEVYRCQRSIAEIPEYQEYLGKANAFREEHKEWLCGAKFRSDALYSCDSDELYSAGHLAPDGSLVILATQSHKDKIDTKFTVPGFAFDKAFFFGKGKSSKEGKVTVERDAVVLLHYTPSK